DAAERQRAVELRHLDELRGRSRCQQRQNGEKNRKRACRPNACVHTCSLLPRSQTHPPFEDRARIGQRPVSEQAPALPEPGWHVPTPSLGRRVAKISALDPRVALPQHQPPPQPLVRSPGPGHRLSADARPRTPWRDNVEALVMAVVMALFLKYFVVE